MSSAVHINTRPLNRLRWRWVIFTIVNFCFLILGFVFLNAAWQAQYAQRWLLIASITSLYLVIILWFSLERNHHPGSGQLMPVFGIGSSMSLARGMLLAGLSGFLFSPLPSGILVWLPGLLYLTASILDYFDGYLARRSNQATVLGEILDIRFDSLGVFTAALLAIQYSQLPYWYIIVAFARYIYLFGLWLWGHLGFSVYELQPSLSRRAFAGLQMGFLTVMLLPLFSPPGTYIAAWLFALPFLVGFGRDWLHAAGIIQISGGGLVGLHRTFYHWAPLVFRFAVSGTIFVIFFLTFQQEKTLSRPLSLIMTIELAVAVLIALGAAGRISSIIGLCLLGFAQMYSPLSMIQILLAAGYVSIIYMGTGEYSLWTPEDRLIFYRYGSAAKTMVEANST